MSIKPVRRIISAMSNFYRRPLPKSCIGFSSESGKQLFKESLLSGHMESYFRLASQFRTQDEPAFCGLATLVMVLNSLEIDPGRIWKGPWRWYHEEMLDCCIPIETIKENGITFEQFSCLAKCNSLKVDEYRFSDIKSISQFRDACESITQKDDEFLVASYSRKGLQQTGDGHFAPVGGYHVAQDKVLLFDTARFKYPPHWVSMTDLWNSMSMIDKVTNLPRGYLIISRDPESSGALLLGTSTQLTEYLLLDNAKLSSKMTPNFEQNQLFMELTKQWSNWFLEYLNCNYNNNNNNNNSNSDDNIWSSATLQLINGYLQYKHLDRKCPKFPLTCNWYFGDKKMENFEDILCSLIKEITDSSVGRKVEEELNKLSTDDLEWLSKYVFEMPKFQGCNLMLLQDSMIKMNLLITSWLLMFTLNGLRFSSNVLLKVNEQLKSIKQLSQNVIEQELSSITQEELKQLSNKFQKMENCKNKVNCCSNVATD